MLEMVAGQTMETKGNTTEGPNKYVLAGVMWWCVKSEVWYGLSNIPTMNFTLSTGYRVYNIYFKCAHSSHIHRCLSCVLNIQKGASPFIFSVLLLFCVGFFILTSFSRCYVTLFRRHGESCNQFVLRINGKIHWIVAQNEKKVEPEKEWKKN